MWCGKQRQFLAGNPSPCCPQPHWESMPSGNNGERLGHQQQPPAPQSCLRSTRSGVAGVADRPALIRVLACA
eukprot:gene23648-biopygen19352